MLLLTALAPMMKAKHVSKDRLAHIADIAPPRVHKLMYPTLATEPWFDEAVAIYRVLGTAGITPLIGVGAFTRHDLAGMLPMPLPNDLDMLRAGVRLPLGLACNIALQLGLRDPVDLIVPDLSRELWRIIATGERTGRLTTSCPWCDQPIVGDAGHLPTCLPNNLWGGRGAHMVASPIDHLPRPPRKGERTGSAPARGLASLRAEMRLTQKEMAARLGTDSNTYAQLERCDRPLTHAMSGRFSQAINTKRERFYIDPAARG